MFALVPGWPVAGWTAVHPYKLPRRPNRTGLHLMTPQEELAANPPVMFRDVARL
jgi:hypothetical protein